MLYLLLIVPHLLITAGLLAYAYRTKVAMDDDGTDGGEWPLDTIPPRPPAGDLPLPEATSPRRRLQVGERLDELHPRRARREHPTEWPQRTASRRDERRLSL